MEGHTQNTDLGAPLNRSTQSRSVSERKLKANRENAKKSTGPRTPRGKAYSRNNATKHGLFVTDFQKLMEEEDPREFEARYRDLRDELEPVGPSEEGVVWQIAICWLRLERLWRYENAQQASDMQWVSSQAEDGTYYQLAMSETQRDHLALLKTAKREVEASGEISAESMKELFKHFEIRLFWPSNQAAAEKTAKKKRNELALEIAKARRIELNEAKQLLAREAKTLPEYKRFVALETVSTAIKRIGEVVWNRSQAQIQYEYHLQLIPSDDEVRKIIRYGTTFERQLSRAYDWLERLQRRRKGLPVAPAVNVHRTQ
ncbi:MAG TPA: hypothetical protein VFB28_10395 [Terriglobales bacterium]|nr:hypothetical protein [Terriglobales bacterium]